MEKEIKKFIEEFFVTLGIKTNIEISETDEEISLVLDTEDSGMIIGYHGETLEALQLVLSLALAKKTGEFKRVSIEVGDYKKNREEWLTKLASDSKDKALSQQREVVLSDLKAWERRVIHLILSDDKEVVSESSGEGRDRVLVVRPK
jgi:spoIIIJ-associated protein